jgi:hypothetical protein
MDTSLNLSPTAGALAPSAPVLERSMTTKVQAVEGLEDAATLPAEKPFVAQVVTARLSGAEYPENPTEIAPQDRTLRPYDVPMLPYDREENVPAERSQDDTSKPV